MDRLVRVTVLTIFVHQVRFCVGQTTQEMNTTDNTENTDVFTDVFTDVPSSEQVNNESDSGFPAIGENVLTSSIDKGMVPIYDITNYFLKQVMSTSSLSALNQKVNLTDERAILDSLENDWEMWMEHYISYAIVAVIGALFCVFTPLIGCIICCCRYRGRCGGKKEPIEAKYAKCQRIICGALLLILSTPILLAVTTCFLATSLVRYQTLPSGTMQDISSSLGSVDNYLDITRDQITRLKVNLFEDPFNRIQYKLRSFPVHVQDQVSETSEAGQLLNKLENYVEKIPEIIQTLNDTGSKVQELQTQAYALNITINSVVSNFLGIFSSCDLQQCNASKLIMETLEVTANFTGQDLSVVAADIESVQNGSDNITASIQEGKDKYNGIAQLVETVTNEIILELQIQLEKYDAKFDNFSNQAKAQIEDIKMVKARQDINETIKQDVDEIGYYAYISLNAISSLTLLIVTLLFVGLLFGCCGDRGGPDVEFCNRGNGASTLKVAMVMFFLLSWILMATTTVMLLGGGLSYTEICRQLLLEESQEDLVVIDNVITTYTNMSGASARTIMENCEQDQPFYKAFEVEKHYPQLDVSKAIDLSNFDLEGTLNELLSKNYSLGNIMILNNVTIVHLSTMEVALQNVEIDYWQSISQQNITNFDLLKLSSMFEEYATELENSSSNEANMFREYSEQLKKIYNDEVAEISLGMSDINEMMTSIESYDAAMNLTTFVPEMQSAQDSVTSRDISNAVNVTMNPIFADLTSLTKSIEFTVVNLIGPCYGVYNAISVSVSSICVSFLYPFNAFWLGMMMSLIFFILSIPVVFSLITQYRKTVSYISTEEVVVGVPRMNRGRLNQDADGVRSSLASDRRRQPQSHVPQGHVPQNHVTQVTHHQGDVSRMPSAPPAYEGADNNGYVPDSPDYYVLEYPDYENDDAIIEFHRTQVAPSQGESHQPTQIDAIELRPRNQQSPSQQRHQNDNGMEQYF